MNAASSLVTTERDGYDGGIRLEAAMLSRRSFLRRAVATATVPLLNRASLRGDTVSRIEPFGNAKIIQGHPRERGRAYGKIAQNSIHSFFEKEILAAFVGKPFVKDELLRYADECFKVIHEVSPEIAEEIDGMAEGCGLRREEIVLITLHEELYHRGVLPPVSHCTAVAVSPPETAAGVTLCGQTWDWMQSVAGLSSVCEWRRNGGPSLLAYGFPGMPVGAGLNSHGLALCWTSAALGIKNQQPRIGLPSYVLLTHFLYQESLDAVIEEARRNRHAGWFTFVMADGAGRLLNVEGSPERIGISEAKGRLIRVGYGQEELQKSIPGGSLKRHARCEVVDKLLDGSRGKTSVQELQRYFASPSAGVCVGAGTIDMMVYDTTNRRAYLSRGPEYGVAWKEYRFTSDDDPTRRSGAP